MTTINIGDIVEIESKPNNGYNHVWSIIKINDIQIYDNELYLYSYMEGTTISWRKGLFNFTKHPSPSIYELIL